MLPFEQAYVDGNLTDFLKGYRVAFRKVEADAHAIYNELLAELAVSESESYNLLWSRDYMWVVVRKQAEVLAYQDTATVSVNSMGFAGTFFVKNQESLDFLKARKPLWFLEQVAMPRHQV